jgi:uncharacterized protein
MRCFHKAYANSGRGVAKGVIEKPYTHCYNSRRFKMKYIIGFLLIFYVSLGYSASFDCNRANTAVEKLICGDNELSKLDDELNNVYKSALMKLKANDRQNLLEEQKSWLKYTRALCDDLTCLKKTYAQRIKELSRSDLNFSDTLESFEQDGEHYNIVTLHDPNYRISSFNEDLSKRNEGKIVGCYMLIDVPVGTAHGNHSYGGFCTLINGSKKTNVLICNDDMVGNFQMFEINKATPEKKDLIEFTISNCYGG